MIASLLLFVGACGSNIKPASHPEQKNNISTKNTNVLSENDKREYYQALDALKENNFSTAEKLLKEISAKDASSAPIFANLALTYYKLQQYEPAQAAITSALTIDNASAEIENLAGLIAIEMKKYKSAEDHFKKAIAINNGFSNAHYNIALLYDIYYQDIEKAFIHYNRYLSLVGNNDEETKDWVDQLQLSLKK